MGLQDVRQERMSTIGVRLFLKEFCVEFLNGVYNTVMKFARSCIINCAYGETSETMPYLWAVRFFMEFNRYHDFQLKYIR
jgi:timeless